MLHMFNNKRSNAKLVSYAIPPLITCLAMITIMMIRRIYPFGDTPLGYNDNMQQVVPMYSLIWDVLHGRASSVYSIQIGMGTDLSALKHIFSNISPFNLLLLLTPRSYIPEFLSIMTIVKMSFMSAAMYFFFNHDKAFSGTSYAFKVLFSVMYSLCGYALLYSAGFSPWLDVMAVFPIFMLSFNKMLDTGKKLFYIIMVYTVMTMNSSLGAVILLYAFIMAGGRMCVEFDRSKADGFKDALRLCGRSAGNMTAATLAGTGASMFTLLPAGIRAYDANEASLLPVLKEYKQIICGAGEALASGVFGSFMIIYGASFAFAMIIIGLLCYRKEQRNTRYILFSLAVVFIPLVFGMAESLLDIKGYGACGIHFGFITSFTVIQAGCYFAGKPMQLKRQKAERIIETSFEPLEKLVYILAGMTLCGIAAYIYNRLSIDSTSEALVFLVTVFLLLTAVDIVMCMADRGCLCAKSCYVSVAVEIFAGMYAMMGASGVYNADILQEAESVMNAENVSISFDIQRSQTDGIKNPDWSLGSNYPLILQRPSVCDDFYTDESKVNAAYALGYGKMNNNGRTAASDIGGTAFSDALLHMTQAVSMEEESGELYKKTASQDGFNLYNMIYTLPYGMTVVSDELVNMDPDDWVSVNNAFYSAIMGRHSDIVTRADVAYENGGCVISVEGRQAVYVRVFSDIPADIYVNGVVLNASKLINNAEDFNDGSGSGLIFLGVFEDEDVAVDIAGAGGSVKNARLDAGLMDMSKLAIICNMMKSNTALSADETEIRHGNVIRLTVTKSGGRDMLLLPITYDSNWGIEVNGRSVQPVYTGNKMLMGIPLEDGENVIKMSYIPKGTGIGLAISIVAILIIIGSYWLSRQAKINVPDILKGAAGGAYVLLWALLLVWAYAAPVLTDIINAVKILIT